MISARNPARAVRASLSPLALSRRVLGRHARPRRCGRRSCSSRRCRRRSRSRSRARCAWAASTSPRRFAARRSSTGGRSALRDGLLRRVPRAAGGDADRADGACARSRQAVCAHRRAGCGGRCRMGARWIRRRRSMPTRATAGKPVAELAITYYLTPTGGAEQTPVWTREYRRHAPMRDSIASRRMRKR